MNLIDKNISQLYQLCENHKVEQLYLFGSILNERFQDTSDIDMLIQFYQIDLKDYFDNYMNLKEKLEQLFIHPIDLVEDQAIKNPIFRRVVDREKKLIDERKNS